MFEWWNKDFKEYLKLDICTLDFDKDNGYAIYNLERFDLLVLKFECFKNVYWAQP